MSAQWVDLNDVLKEETERSVVELDRWKPRPTISTYRLRRAVGPMSEKFIEGIEEKLDRAEKKAYRDGKWLDGDAS